MLIHLLVALVITLKTEAVLLCPPTKSLVAGPSDLAKYLHRVDVYGPPDRRSAQAFGAENGNISAAVVTKRFAASADFQCGGLNSQAQLVVKNNTVLVNNHSLPGSPCVSQDKLGQCKVTFNEGGRLVPYKVKALKATGYRCKPGWENQPGEDWAILELDRPVSESIRPYAVKTAPCASNERPVDVVAVGKSVDYGAAPSKGWTHWQKHYANCQLRLGVCAQSYPAMESDCDASHGTSGGGMFVGGDSPELIGIVQNGNEGCGKANTTGVGEYKQGCWSSIYVPITAALSEELNPNGRSKETPPSMQSPPGHPARSNAPQFQDL